MEAVDLQSQTINLANIQDAYDPGTTLPTEYVQKYAPSVKFHGDERVFPCSIEYLMQGGSLKYRTWRPAQTVDGQQTGVPAVVAFNGYLYMIYTGSHDSEIWVTRTEDGSNWTDTHQIGQQTSVPAVAAFQNKLWMVYTGAHSAQLYVTCSSDGLTWEGPREIAGQKTSIPALTVFEGHLFMCYSSDSSSQLFQTQSDNGWDWYNTKEIDGQGSDIPALTVIPGPDGDQVLMVYPSNDKGDDGQLLQTRYTSKHGWSAPAWINGQKAWQVGLSNYQGKPIMAYTSNHSSQMFASSSADGINWDCSEVPGQSGKAWPALCTFQDRTYMLYSDTDSSKQIWVSSVKGTDLAPRPAIANPTQQDLANCGSDPDYWIDIDGNKWSSVGPSPTTLYFAMQEDTNAWYVHYIFLYAGQNGQTVRAERSGTDFNARIWRIGEHPGDLERFMAKISKGTDGKTKVGDVIDCEYEAHGDTNTYTPDQIDWESDSHAIVAVALNNHSIWNEKMVGDHPYEENIPGVVMIGNFLGGSYGDGQIWWRPWTPPVTSFVQLGLDKSGKAINDQIWATFKGRMGDSYSVGLDGAHYFGGGNLSTFDWDFVKIVWAGGQISGKIASGLRYADGPRGPGDRNWVRPL